MKRLPQLIPFPGAPARERASETANAAKAAETAASAETAETAESAESAESAAGSAARVLRRWRPISSLWPIAWRMCRSAISARSRPRRNNQPPLRDLRANCRQSFRQSFMTETATR